MQRYTACLALSSLQTLTTGVRPHAQADPSLQPTASVGNNGPATGLVSADTLMRDGAGGLGLTAFSLRYNSVFGKGWGGIPTGWVS